MSTVNVSIEVFDFAQHAASPLTYYDAHIWLERDLLDRQN